MTTHLTFSTEASVNLADDDELLHMMRDANFFALFIGIESPDPETLVAMSKEAKHSPQSGRKHWQNLSGRHVRHRRFHRWLRQ